LMVDGCFEADQRFGFLDNVQRIGDFNDPQISQICTDS
jgi:hypothetical protein